MTLSYTPRFHLAIPDFLSEPWHTEFATAMFSIDQALYSAIVATNTALWENSHAYAIGDLVIDSATGALYSCAVAHTSAATPATFADDRLAHPTYWTSFVVVLATQSEAEIGTENSKYMSPLRVAQAIDVQVVVPGIASQPQAEAGTDNATIMTPLRVAQAIDAQVPVTTAFGFSAHKNAVAQTGIVSNVPTKLTFGTELYDLGSYYDTATSRWTPPAGIVHIDAGLYFTSGLVASSNASISVYKNGVQYKQRTEAMPTADGGIGISINDNASGTDYYEIFALGSSGSTITVNGGITLTFFMGHVIH